MAAARRELTFWPATNPPCNLDSVINIKTFQAIQKAVIGGGIDDERSDSESELFEDENDNRLKKDN